MIRQSVDKLTVQWSGFKSLYSTLLNVIAFFEIQITVENSGISLNVNVNQIDQS